MTADEMANLKAGDTVWISTIRRAGRVVSPLVTVPADPITVRWFTEDARVMTANLYPDEIEVKRPA